DRASGRRAGARAGAARGQPVSCGSPRGSPPQLRLLHDDLGSDCGNAEKSTGLRAEGGRSQAGAKTSIKSAGRGAEGGHPPAGPAPKTPHVLGNTPPSGGAPTKKARPAPLAPLAPREGPGGPRRPRHVRRLAARDVLARLRIPGEHGAVGLVV